MKKLNIDKTNWTKVRLSDVALEPKENSKDLIADGIAHIVGLEHITSEDIHLRDSFPIGTDTTFTKRFKKRDILFGRRRAYLKKAAVADFDGVCSGDITVIRAIEEKILPELLPFVIHNDKFFDYAIKHSAGGLSPRVKYKDLANYEFLLPPKEEQAELAELLWAMDEVVEKDREVVERGKTHFSVQVNDKTSFHKEYCSKVFKISELGNTFTGLSGKSKKDFGEGKPYVPYLNIYQNLEINLEQMDFVKIKSNENQNLIQYGDFFFTGSSETPDEVGISSVLLDEVDECYLNSFCFGFRLNDFNNLLPEYAKYLFRNKDIRIFMNKRAQGSTRFNLSKSDFMKYLIIKIPSTENQEIIIKELREIENVIPKLETKYNLSKSLIKGLIEEIF